MGSFSTDLQHARWWPRRAFVRRIGRYARGSREAFHVRLWLAQAIIHCIPQGLFGNVRAILYRWAGFTDIGRWTYIYGTLDLRGDGDLYPRLHIGEGTVINVPCMIEMNAPVRIGKWVGIGHHAQIITSSHEYGPPDQRRGRIKAAPVTIGDGAWIGAGSMILPGITIGSGAFVSAGSIVTKDVPSNAQVAGNPARVVGHLPDSASPAS